MAFMVSTVFLCVILLQSVWADHCTSYWGTDGVYHDVQQCGLRYCCGDCSNKYCCSRKENYLTQEQQEACNASGFSSRSGVRLRNVGVIVGAIFASIFPVVLCVALITCCLCPCCLLYQKCRKRRNQRQQIVVNTTHVSNVPVQPASPQHPSYPGYQPVPVGYGGPSMPTAPPHLYLETTPAPSFPMDPLQPPGQSYPPPPPYSDDLAHPPYNPSYGPNA